MSSFFSLFKKEKLKAKSSFCSIFKKFFQFKMHIQLLHVIQSYFILFLIKARSIRMQKKISCLFAFIEYK